MTKCYGGREVVKGVSLGVLRGEIVGLLGPNGAGKTTTFDMLVGFEKPDGGDIYLDDQRLTDHPVYLRARLGISYLPQEASIFRKMTVEENLLAILEVYRLTPEERERRKDRLLEDFRIGHLAEQKAYTLSGGERRRVEIARALTSDPAFILLDEPFSGIDPIAVLEIQQLIRWLKSRGIGVLMTDHNVRETLKITDKAYIINDGKIFRSGPPSELSRDTEVQEIYLGEGFILD